jgi:putative nucleotidyltransferase with HDIG domain
VVELSAIQGSNKETYGSLEHVSPKNSNGNDPVALTGISDLALGFPGSPDDFSGVSREEIIQERADSHSFPISQRSETDEIVSFWERGFWENRKISLAREVLMRLDQRYRKIFKSQDSSYNEGGIEKESFLKSNLLYLIAITDGNEDTLGHSQLVSRYTILFARELGFEDRSFLIDLEKGALLHDVGKIGIPEFVLRKNGPLTEREKEVVREHPLLGYEMIKGFDFLEKSAHVVLYHHECYDGTGYSFGLRGEDIPLGARIFALADTLDAITSDRPYRRGKTFEDAFKEIEKGRDTQFDPLLTDVFLSIPKEKWLDIKENSRISLPLSAVH